MMSTIGDILSRFFWNGETSVFSTFHLDKIFHGNCVQSFGKFRSTEIEKIGKATVNVLGVSLNEGAKQMSERIVGPMMSVNERPSLTRNRYKGSLGGSTSVLPVAAAMIKMISMDILRMDHTVLDNEQHKKCL